MRANCIRPLLHGVTLLLALALALSSVLAVSATHLLEDVEGPPIVEITQNPGEFAGQDVTTRGRVREVVGDRGLIIGQGEAEILVIAGPKALERGVDMDPLPTNIPQLLDIGVVTVQGEVREQFDRQDVQAELDVQLSRELEDFAAEPFIFADQITYTSPEIDYTPRDVDLQEQLGQLEEEQQQLEAERQQVEEELQQAEEEDAPQREIRQLEQELQQIEEEQQQLEEEQAQLEEEQALERRGQDVTLRELIRNPREFEGHRVRVTADLVETQVPHLYGLVAGNQQIALIAAPDVVPEDAEGEVTAIGTVHRFTVDQLIESAGVQAPQSLRDALRELAPPLIAIEADRVVDDQAADQQDQQLQGQLRQLEAERQQVEEELRQAEEEDAPQREIRQLERELQQIEEEQQQLEEQQRQLEGRQGQAEQVQIGNLDEFAGQNVTIVGHHGGDIDREAFTVEVNGDEVLVVGDRQAIPGDLGGQVEVRGEIREQFNERQVERELGVNLNLDQDEQARFDNQPFIVAEDVRNAAEDARDQIEVR